MPGKLRRYFIEMNMVGGRGGTRTRGPLLAKHVIPGPNLVPLIANRKRDNVRPRSHGDELSAIEHIGHG